MRYTNTLLLFLILSGCQRSALAPVEEIRPQYSMNHAQTNYKVRDGDTLYAIAFLFEKSPQQLANLNGIPYPYRLRTGQILNLSTRMNQTAAPKQYSLLKTVAPQKNGDWVWPTQGQLSSSAGTPIESKGLNILGQFGQPIYASKSGVVAYAGNGLPGYGQLILIKNSNDYLTAYAFNSQLLVHEGQMVQKKQQIARMGYLSPGKAGLHFEIRYRGLAINPLRFLK